MELDFNDILIGKIYETIFEEMPEQNKSMYKEPKIPEETKYTKEYLIFKWHGLNALFSDKKETVQFKLINL
jgi:hypothetical protein